MSFDDEAPTACCAALPRRWSVSGPPLPPPTDFAAADAFVWHARSEWLEPVKTVNRVDIDLLRGIERQREALLPNTQRFAQGLPANNALLWGARGTGKSSLVKAVHAAVNAEHPGLLALVEIHREEIPSLPRLLTLLREAPRRFLLFAMTSPSRARTPATSRSKRCSKAGSRDGRPMWCSTQPRIVAT